MADDEHLKILKQGVDVWNQWRKDNPNIRPDLNKAELVGMSFVGANLSAANLSAANLHKANLRRATLHGAELSAANLSAADLHKANLRGGTLHKADLSWAILIGANLSLANLSEAKLGCTTLMDADLSAANLNAADLTGATIAWTKITNVNLSEVKGLQSINHEGPSSIGLDTIYKSQGRIPEEFLRGAGVPDNFIKYLTHLIGDAIQFYSCFISYSTKDQEFAERLHSDLQDKGVRCWFAPEDIKGGRKLHEQIPEAIRLYDKLLLVLSENSMNSEWVKTEIYHARQDEIHTGKRKLFPIGLIGFEAIRKWQAFDADVGKDMAREVREYYIPDFSNWKNHDSYKKAFDRLLRDLQSENKL